MVHTLFTVVTLLLAVAVFVLAFTLLYIRRKTLPSERPKKLRPRTVALALCTAALGLVMAGKSIYDHSQKPADMGNPFFTGWDTPFGVPPFDRMEPEYFKPAFEEGMRIQTAEIDSIVSNPAEPTFDNVILALDRSGELYSMVGRIFSGITSAETTDELEAVKAEMSPLRSKHGDGISMNPLLFEKIRSVYDRRATMNLNAAQVRLLELTYKRFVRNGALLNDADKERLKAINEELSLLSIRFGNNRRESVNAFELVIDSRDATGMPSGEIGKARNRAKEKGLENKLVFTLQKPSLLPFLTNADDEDLRRRLYEGYLNQCAAGSEFDNTQIINDIIRLRTEKAHLMGFGSWAEFVLDERMAKTPEAVYSLLDEIWDPALERATGERDELLALKRKEKGDTLAELYSWDWWYYAEKVRKNRYNFDEEQARPYFSLENVKSGIFSLCNRLYGIGFRPVKVPVYHPDVAAYEVLDIDNSHLGVIYMDFFPRPGKGAGAWCGSYRSQSFDSDGNKIYPITTIVCNFTEPSGSTPSLLTLDEVETFFHEFGHALHNLFSDVPYQGLQTIERDFVELPSQLMENWAFEPQMLKSYAIHYRTGEPMTDVIIRRIREASLFNQGFNTVELIAASFSDMDIHMQKEYTPFNVADFESYALTTKRGLIPEIAPRYHYPYFNHIFNGGYSAGYYGYTWAAVFDKDAYEAFVETGDIFDRRTALDFRNKVMAPRGSKDGMDLYIDFRGHEPSREPLLKARGLLKEPDISPDSLAVMRRREHETQPREPLPDSVLRIILDEGPLVE